MIRAALLALLLVLPGCAGYSVRDNAEDTCWFAFLAAVPIPASPIIAAAACTFGLRLLPDDTDEDEEE